MNEFVDTLLLVHLAGEWETFHRRYLLLALAKSLPANAAMVCVNRPITIDVTSWKYPRKFWTGVWLTRVQIETPRLRVITPRMLSHEMIASRIPGMTRVNRALIRTQLVRFIDSHFPRVQKVIHWLYHPVQTWVTGAVDHSGIVYECYDEYSRTPLGKPALWDAKAEDRLLQMSDITFATSRALVESRRRVGNRVLFLPNGVASSFFATPLIAADAIDAIPRPRIGCLGTVRELLDFTLLEEIFSRNPEWNLVFIGPVHPKASIHSIAKLKNVHFLGQRQYNSLPGVLKRLDVGLIPHADNEYTRAVNPMRLYEYGAVGLPVVSTPLPEVQRFAGVITIAPAESGVFARGIRETLDSDREVLSRALRAAVREYSWETIVEKRVLPALREVFHF